MPLILLGDRLMIDPKEIFFAQIVRTVIPPAYPEEKTEEKEVWFLEIHTRNHHFNIDYPSENQAMATLKHLHRLANQESSSD